MGFGDKGFRVEGIGFRVLGLGLRVWDVGFGTNIPGCRLFQQVDVKHDTPSTTPIPKS